MSESVLTARARHTLIRNHPDWDEARKRWADRGYRGDIEIPDIDLLTWASALSDRELLRFRNLGRTTLADIRAFCEPWPGLVEVQ